MGRWGDVGNVIVKLRETLRETQCNSVVKKKLRTDYIKMTYKK